jgi:hypothetical protein
MTKLATTGKAVLTHYGKRQVATSMYVKGKAFIGAAVLVRRQPKSEQTEQVMLHLLCQGIEVTLKGLLLLRDYDRFILRLRKPIGHDLCMAAHETRTAYGLESSHAELDDELLTLSNLYSKHLLRYGTGYDILVDSRTIPRERVFRRLVAVIRLTERELKRG